MQKLTEYDCTKFLHNNISQSANGTNIKMIIRQILSW